MRDNHWLLCSKSGETKHASEAGLVLALDTKCRYGFDGNLEATFPDGTVSTGAALESWWRSRTTQ
jgi:hypothetical protein